MRSANVPSSRPANTQNDSALGSGRTWPIGKAYQFHPQIYPQLLRVKLQFYVVSKQLCGHVTFKLHVEEYNAPGHRTPAFTAFADANRAKSEWRTMAN
jgi:hypothetical protein